MPPCPGTLAEDPDVSHRITAITPKQAGPVHFKDREELTAANFSSVT